MSIADILKKTNASLRKLDPLGNEALLLLSHVLNRDQAYLLTHGEETVNAAHEHILNQLVEKRLAGHSLAAVIGSAFFYGLKFKVTRDTLIPRADSEIMVDRAVAALSGRTRGSILDMGTGSGNLIIAVAATARKKFPDVKLMCVAADISSKALKVAQQNARDHHLTIQFHESNLFDQLPRQRFDIIMANLPYLATPQLFEPSIAQEPMGALWGGDDGLDLYRTFLQKSPAFINPDGTLLIEIDPLQADAAELLAQKYFPRALVTRHYDLTGNVRVVGITLNT